MTDALYICRCAASDSPWPVCLQVSAGCVLLLGATALGTTAYLFTDLRQRRTYLETRKVMEVKTSIEEQSRTRVGGILCTHCPPF